MCICLSFAYIFEGVQAGQMMKVLLLEMSIMNFTSSRTTNLVTPLYYFNE